MASERLSRAQQKFKILNSTKNGEELAQVIQLNSKYTQLVLDDIWQLDGDWSLLSVPVAHGLWNEVAATHFAAAAAYRQGDYVTAYRHQLASYHAFLRAFRSMARWGIGTLLSMCKDLCRVARLADAQLAAAAGPSGDAASAKTEEATRAINQGFSLCMTDREPVPSKSRKWGTYRMANIMFPLYRQLGAHNMCDSMIRAIKAAGLPELTSFPMADQVTFRFYRGILAFRSESYTAAKEDLLFALENCHRDAYRNKVRILTYLAPLQMAEGQMPQSRLMRRYPPVKAMYGDLAKAAKTGDLRRFDDLLQEKEQQFAAAGVFVAAERVRRVAVRQLLRRIHHHHGGESRISFQQFCDGFAAAGIEGTTVPEIEAILADMIAAGYLKGYLAHDHGMAVLSKQQPFPLLRTLHPAARDSL
ncbi:COP9 signalosome (CSN) subunit [Coemansia javaensis]|uniref:COP9 signalosome (CSN) subunit n=1 Tax=Coemansia javaensis TaxID=2761396 RepID=A0A9W8HL44_9FUNG|nr:COP9 signalosome (CSN) subunit [Coemansia javaensis]